MSELEFDPHNVLEPHKQSVNQDPLQCFHFHSRNHRCGSPAMRGEYFCYHHRNDLKPAPIVILPTTPFDLPPLTDRAAILRAADEIASRIACNYLDIRRARTLLYAVQIAAAHLPIEAPPAASPSSPELTTSELPATSAVLSIEIEHTQVPALHAPPADTAASNLEH